MAGSPTVSVCMITYNHEPFIAQAIEGVLMQETDFAFELIIGEDCSTDRTGKLIEQYQIEYPKKVRMLSRPTNIGMMLNFVDTLSICRGKYIALCEGDDFWTDPKKLSIQVDFMERNPDFAICFHGSTVHYDDQSRPDRRSAPVVPDELDFDDLLAAKGNVIRTESCMFRNGLFGEFPYNFRQLKLVDWPLHLLNAQHGKAKYIDRYMSVYRIHAGGVWSGKKSVKNILDYAEAVEACKQYFSPRAEKEFDEFLAYLYADAAFFMFNEGNFEDFLYHIQQHEEVLLSISFRTKVALQLRKNLLRFPVLAKIYSIINANFLKKGYKHPELSN